MPVVAVVVVAVVVVVVVVMMMMMMMMTTTTTTPTRCRWVEFDNVRVPAQHLIGEEGMGFMYVWRVMADVWRVMGDV